MVVVVGISLLIFVLVCSAVGIRVLHLAARARGGADLYCGLGFTSIGLIGYPASLVSGNGIAEAGAIVFPAFVLGMIFTNGGIAAFFAFTQQVFRPNSRWAARASGAASGILAVGAVGAIRAIAMAEPDAASFDVTYGWNLLLQIASTTCFGWTALEGLLHWQMARRRLALGLADALIVNRLGLWTMFGLSTMLLSGVFIVAQLIGIPTATSAVVHVSTAVFGLASSLAIYLGFFPPEAYRRAVQASAARTTRKA